jgi:hypothetical protein
VTVPVKLCKAQNSMRKVHQDSHFGNGSVRYLKDLAGIFGHSTVFALSQDDKARVAMGLPAANKQAPILMHLEYKVTLPDHDYVIAPKHKLIPSVYAGLTFNKLGELSYSGPTYISVRSGKHDKSTAQSHSEDLRKLVNTESFRELAKVFGSETYKPIFIIFTDGGPDENPRFPKTLQYASQIFKEFDLDAIFIVTHAPGQSAYNQVERRMAPLSRDLSGIILPHDTYGSHLSDSGKTVDPVLELKNFQKAGESLADVWSTMVIDKYPVEAKYVLVQDNPDEVPMPDEKWKSIHVRQSRYLLQILKCKDRRCCKSPKTNVKEFLSEGFLPAPVLIRQTNAGLDLCDPKKPEEIGTFGTLALRLSLHSIPPIHAKTFGAPFDLYCPSLQGKLDDLVCKTCRLYLPSKSACTKHQTVHKPRSAYFIPLSALHVGSDNQRAENAGSSNATSVVEENNPVPYNDPNETNVSDNQDEEAEDPNYIHDVDPSVPDIEIINDLSEWYSSPFEEEQ